VIYLDPAGKSWNGTSNRPRSLYCVLFFISYLSFVEFVLGAFAKLRKATLSFVLSVRMEQLGSHWTDYLKFDI
jgi:hypothetical protein